MEVEEEVEEEVKTEFTIDELEGSARQRALDKMYEWAAEYGWFRDTQEHWATEVLPNEWAIVGVDHESMYFDMDRGQSLALTDGRVDLKKLVALKPEWFTNIALWYACTEGWIYDPNVRTDGRGEDTRGIVGFEFDTPYFKGTPFDGIEDADDFWDMIDLVEFEKLLDEHVRDAARAALEALTEEYEDITSEETLVENARANEYLFDEDGNKL